MGTLYEDDVIAWAEQQAALLRAGRWELLDIDNIAEEIEDVGKSEKRELQSRLTVLFSHLLKWKFQQTRRTNSWRKTIRTQRAEIKKDIKKCPSLKTLMNNPAWVETAYHRAVVDTYTQTLLPGLPSDARWSVAEAMSDEFFPE